MVRASAARCHVDDAAGVWRDHLAAQQLVSPLVGVLMSVQNELYTIFFEDWHDCLPHLTSLRFVLVFARGVTGVVKKDDPPEARSRGQVAIEPGEHRAGTGNCGVQWLVGVKRDEVDITPIHETFLQRNFGESGGYLYEWENQGDDYDFQNLGSDPSLYANYLDLKTDQDTPDLQTFANFIQAVNTPDSNDAEFITSLTPYLDPKLFLTYAAIENTLSEADGVVGGILAVNNFYLYQFQGTTLFQFIAWDKDLTFSDPNRDIMQGFDDGPYINVLAQRLIGIYEYKQTYLKMLWKAASVLGEAGGWADQEVTREYGVIHDAAVNDPNKQCLILGVLHPCGNNDFEEGVQNMHDFLAQRAGYVRFQATYAGYQPSAEDPQIADGGISEANGAPQISPGAFANASGSNLSFEPQAGTAPWPRVLGNTWIAVDGVRAPLMSTAPDHIVFQIPPDLAPGHVAIAASVNGAMSNTADVVLGAAGQAASSLLSVR